MSRIRGKGNKSTELRLASAFRAAGISRWRRHVGIVLKVMPCTGTPPPSAVLVVRPDFVFRRERLVVFVDGCFWHQCPLHSKVPTSNRVFWQKKLGRNVERDKATTRLLRNMGWRVVRVWEHELDQHGRAVGRVRRALAK